MNLYRNVFDSLQSNVVCIGFSHFSCFVFKIFFTDKPNIISDVSSLSQQGAQRVLKTFSFDYVFWFVWAVVPE